MWENWGGRDILAPRQTHSLYLFHISLFSLLRVHNVPTVRTYKLVAHLSPLSHGPHEPGPAVGDSTGLHLWRLGRVVAAPGDGLGVDPAVGVDAVARHPAVLDALAAGVGALYRYVDMSRRASP